MKKYLIFLGILVFLLLLFRPVSLSRNDSIQISGILESTSYDKNNHDLSIKIVGDNREFYINRALEKGIQPIEFGRSLDKKLLRFSYVDQWTFLDPLSQVRHITELSIGDSLVFSEFK